MATVYGTHALQRNFDRKYLVIRGKVVEACLSPGATVDGFVINNARPEAPSFFSTDGHSRLPQFVGRWDIVHHRAQQQGSSYHTAGWRRHNRTPKIRITLYLRRREVGMVATACRGSNRRKKTGFVKHEAHGDSLQRAIMMFIITLRRTSAPQLRAVVCRKVRPPMLSDKYVLLAHFVLTKVKCYVERLLYGRINPCQCTHRDIEITSRQGNTTRLLKTRLLQQL